MFQLSKAKAQKLARAFVKSYIGVVAEIKDISAENVLLLNQPTKNIHVTQYSAEKVPKEIKVTQVIFIDGSPSYSQPCCSPSFRVIYSCIHADCSLISHAPFLTFALVVGQH